MSESIEELEKRLAEARAKQEEQKHEKKEHTVSKENNNTNKSSSLLSAMKSRVTSYKEEVKKREEAQKDLEEKKSERTYVGKKSLNDSKVTSTTDYHFIPLVSLIKKSGTYEAMRIISGCFSIIFDTGLKSETGKGTKKEIFNISSIKDFNNFENNFNVKVLSDNDRALLERVQQLLWDLRDYYPFFDNVINSNKKNLPPEFMSKYGGRLRINYMSNYMIMPAILLSTEVFSDNGENSSKINKYTLLLFNKSKLIEDWILNIEKWEERAGDKFVTEFNSVFKEPDGSFIYPNYITIRIDDDEKMKESSPNSPTIPNRITDFQINAYDPREFKSKKDGELVINQELLNKVPDFYNIENMFNVSTFEKEKFERLESILLEARSWLAEHAVMVESGSGSVFNKNDSNGENTSTENNVESNNSVDSTIGEDDVPF